MSDHLLNVLGAKETAPAFPNDQAEALAMDLSGACSLAVYPKSITAGKESVFFLGRRGNEKLLGILGEEPGSAAGLLGDNVAYHL